MVAERRRKKEQKRDKWKRNALCKKRKTTNIFARNLSVRDCAAARQLFKLFLGISISARSVAVL